MTYSLQTFGFLKKMLFETLKIKLNIIKNLFFITHYTQTKNNCLSHHEYLDKYIKFPQNLTRKH